MVNTRKSIEKLYHDICNIYEKGYVTDSETGITKPNGNILVVENQKCRISFKNIYAGNQTESGNKVSQEIKLFIAPDIKIKEGSRIAVKRNGRTYEYKSSGVPAIYDSHQEIVLIYVEEYA